MKYQCLIVDDEPVAQQILEKYINQIEALHLVAKCSNAFEAMNILHQEKVDILFLDIKMPLLSGIEMLKTIQNQSKVILTTAFSEFAVESYEYGVADYLLKPISFERFLKSVNKILLPQNIDFINGNSKENITTQPTLIFFKADKKIFKYYLADILFIEGSGNYIKVHTQNDKPLMVLDKLTDLLEKLPPKQFLRVHKSFIINISHLTRIEGNMLFIRDKEIPISNTFKKELEEIIKYK
jgi:DNA-binding LytR/AlgR family response regulator